MNKLTLEQKQKILDDAPIGAVKLLTTSENWKGEKAAHLVADVYIDSDGFDIPSGYQSDIRDTSWAVKCVLADLRTELPQTNKLTSDQIKWEDDAKWAIVLVDGNTVISQSKYWPPLYIEDDLYRVERVEVKTVVDPIVTTVDELKADLNNGWGGLAETNVKLILDGAGDYITINDYKLEESSTLICTIEQFNQCVKELTGRVAVHQAWLTALNDMRAWNDVMDEQTKARGGFLKKAMQACESSVKIEIDKVIQQRNNSLNKTSSREEIPSIKPHKLGDWLVSDGVNVVFVAPSTMYSDRSIVETIGKTDDCKPMVVHVLTSSLSKPESSTEKAERERELNGKQLFNTAESVLNDQLGTNGKEEWENAIDSDREYWMRLSDAINFTGGKA